MCFEQRPEERTVTAMQLVVVAAEVPCAAARQAVAVLVALRAAGRRVVARVALRVAVARVAVQAVGSRTSD